MTRCPARTIAIAALVGACFASAAQAQSELTHEQLHAMAVASFQRGCSPEAYGRFIALANAGHAPAAELALFMSQNDRALFGKDWGCHAGTADDLGCAHWPARTHAASAHLPTHRRAGGGRFALHVGRPMGMQRF